MAEIPHSVTAVEKITIFLSIVAIIVSFGSVVVNQYLINDANQQQQKTYQQNVAQALYSDITVVQTRFGMTSSQNNFSWDGSPGKKTVFSDEDPYYTNNGLFFVFGKDIASFEDTNLSSHLYDYYNKVLQIEIDRSELKQIKDKYGIDEFGNLKPDMSSDDLQKFTVTFTSLLTNINLANDDFRIIDQRLKQNYKIIEQTNTKVISKWYRVNFEIPNNLLP